MGPADTNTVDARAGLPQHLLNTWAVVLNGVVGLNIFVYDVIPPGPQLPVEATFWSDLVDITSSALPEM